MFSTSFRYGLISLLELAGCDQLLQARTIATRHQLAPHYLAVVLADLCRLGLVQSRKGKNGGYRLQCDPQQLTLLELHNALVGIEALAPRPITGQGKGQNWLHTTSQRWAQELATTRLIDLID